MAAKGAHRFYVSGERGALTGWCRCGWFEDASNQENIRHEYRQHVKSGRVGGSWNDDFCRMVVADFEAGIGNPWGLRG